MIKVFIKYVMLCLLLGVTNSLVYAACTLSPGTVNLGTYSSFTVYNSALSAQGYSGFSCRSLPLNIGVLTTTRVTAAITSTTNNMMLRNIDGSGDSIPYLIYPSASYQSAYRVGQTINYRDLNLLTIILGSANVDVPIYIRTSPGANVRSGTYRDTINLYWDYYICSVGVLVCLVPFTGTGNTAITVTAIINKDCAINSAPDISFGSQAMVGQFNTVTQSINLTCTKTEGYKVWFNDGSNKQGNWRRMTDGVNDYLQYHIYQADNVTVWDVNNKQVGAGTGLNQTLIYNARINPSQSELPAGNYTDNITVVVEY